MSHRRGRPLDPETTFTDDEVRRILQRAADHEAAAARAELPEASPLTLDEVEEIGRSVGIAPEFVDSAAHEIALVRRTPPVRTRFGIPSGWTAHRHLDHAPTDEEWEAMVGVFRRIFHRNGVASSFGSVREWSSTAGSAGEAPLTVAARPSSGGAVLAASQEADILTQLPAALGGGIAGMGIVLATLMTLFGEFAGAAMGILLWLSVAGLLVFGGSLFGLRAWTRQQRRRIEKALDEAQRLTGSATGGSGPAIR